MPPTTIRKSGTTPSGATSSSHSPIGSEISERQGNMQPKGVLEDLEEGRWGLLRECSYGRILNAILGRDSGTRFRDAIQGCDSGTI